MPHNPPPTDTIHLRLATLSEAFDRFDPAPFGTRRLAPDVAEYLRLRADELDVRSLFSIAVHLDDADALGDNAALLSDAIHAFFHNQAHLELDERHEVFKTGRQFLAIGIGVYVFFALILWVMEQTARDTVLYRFLSESGVIIAWVIIWRPAEIFFYDWLPLAKRRKLFNRLAVAPVTCRMGEALTN